MGYTAQRDRLLTHAQASAIAVDPKWTDVAIGMPALSGSKGVRLFYGGEGEAPKMPNQSTLVADLIGEHVSLVAWWSLAGLNTSALKAIDDEVYAFKHDFRTRVTADQTLSGDAVAVSMDYAEPDVVVVAGVRFALLGADILVGLTEYPY